MDNSSSTYHRNRGHVFLEHTVLRIKRVIGLGLLTNEQSNPTIFLV